ncbi:6-carboxytetrahydropterin synthase QueD [Archaeoglobus sp.]
MRVGVAEYFDSSHYIPGHEKCGKVHGHTYRVEVEVEGELERGMVIDFADLKNALREVVRELDHRLINEIIDNPTCENICTYIYKRLKEKLKGVRIVRVRLYEGKDKWAELIP